MAIFQPSVLKNVSQDESVVALRWAKFQNFLAKLEFIKDVKEEKYQDGFLHDIFEECLGYTLDNTNPQNFNLEREKKNETDGKKADGVIHLDGKVVGIIELKDQKSKNLDAIEAQAFNYHNSHSSSKYIIISNFDELRFYIDKKTAYEKFSLFNLSYDEFKKLHLILSYESIKEGLPLKLKEKSANFEQQISKELYRDFSIFRTHLFENIVKNNLVIAKEDTSVIASEARQSIDKSTLLRATQKLCDRIIFILFAEDRGLLRHNTIKEIREEFKTQKFTSYALYDIYKFYFNAINEGNEKLNIPKYNGGLFAKDELLDTLIIDDMYLDMEAQKLSDYDFDSEVGVNILGHIFEQSLTDLEEIQANIDNADFDKKQGKRKKDGVFYTPEYITRYIVDNTLGKLCEEKKKELFGSEVLTSPTNTKKLTKAEQAHKQNILDYREWLTNLKILDPACGSGAFLNQALEFLIKEHTLVRDMLLPFEDLTLGYEIEKEILEHNLYGVDINEDAVEIAKLSLWLRTAHKGRELTSLAGKIKCGNSLIDDKSVAKNAFVWEEEFAEVFAQGGFDVVIGNPPYVSLIGKHGTANGNIDYLINKYNGNTYMPNLYEYFVSLGLSVLKNNGLFSLIIPDRFGFNQYFSHKREFILNNYKIESIVYNFDFPGVIVDTMVFVVKNKVLDDYEIKIYNAPQMTEVVFSKKEYLKNNYEFTRFDNQNIKNLIYKMNSILRLDQIADTTSGFGGKSEKITNNRENNSQIEILKGQSILKYTTKESLYFDFIDENITGRTRDISKLGSKEKILIRKTGSEIIATYDNSGIYPEQSLYFIFNLNSEYEYKFVLSFLNSSLMSWYYINYLVTNKDSTPQLKKIDLDKIPIKHISKENQQPFIQKADKMLSLNKQLQETKQNFTKELGLEKLTKKLQNFEELEFEEFVNEYAKAKKLKFADKLAERNFKQEWQAIFENDKALTCKLKTEITKTDKEIDKMVYELYGLSDEDIKIVEGL